MKKVLITGGAGFIGYHLTNNLIKMDYNIDLADNFTRGVKDRFLTDITKNSKVNIIDLDVLDKESLFKLDNDYNYIFHLAAIIGVQHVLKAPFDVLTKNIELLQNVILFGKKQPRLERLVFTSTSEIYAGTLKFYSLKIPTPETTPLTLTELSENRTSYMLSKIYGEALCLHSGLPITIVRPHNFYGPRMGLSHVIPELFKKAYFTEGNEIEVFSLDHKRTFCYIEDAVEMIRLLAETKEAIGEAYNVGNESPEIRIEELAQRIIEITKNDLVIKPGPATEGSPNRRCPDMSKTFKTTGYTPRINIASGLEMTFNWYKENVFLNKGVSAI